MIWLTVKEVAELLNYAENTISKKVRSGEFGPKGQAYKYVSGSSGRGGEHIEIALEALPEQAQKSYHNKKGC